MSLIRRLTEHRSNVIPISSAIPTPTQYGVSDAGIVVNTDTAMRLAAVWACVNLLTDIVAPLPWHAYRDNPDGTRTKVPDPQLLVNPAPEPSLSAADWRGQVMRSLLLRGNAYGLVLETGAYGEPTKIQIVHPDYVNVTRSGPMGPVTFRVLGTEHQLYPLGDLWHLPAFPVPGSPIGLSPIDYARQSIGLGIAAEQFGAQWFGDSAIPSGLLRTDQVLNSEQAADMKARWNEAMQGSREIAVLGAGLEFSAVAVNPNESQFLDTMKFNTAEIARIYGVPPEMIGGESGSSMTYSNVESRFLNLLTLSGRPWIAKLEHSLSGLLRTKLCVRADTDELLRTDAKTRSDLDVADIRAGIRVPDEVRATRDLPPLPDGKGKKALWPPFAVKEESTDDPVEPPPVPPTEGEPNAA